MKNNAGIARRVVITLFFSVLTIFGSCRRQKQNAPANPTPSPQNQAESPHKAPSTEIRNYYGVGVVTKIVKENPYDKSLASVELNHEEIEGLMPAMIMEFYVKDKSLLKGLKVGDKIEFTIEEKGGTEIISEIKKK